MLVIDSSIDENVFQHIFDRAYIIQSCRTIRFDATGNCGSEPAVLLGWVRNDSQHTVSAWLPLGCTTWNTRETVQRNPRSHQRKGEMDSVTRLSTTYHNESYMWHTIGYTPEMRLIVFRSFGDCVDLSTFVMSTTTMTTLATTTITEMTTTMTKQHMSITTTMLVTATMTNCEISITITTTVMIMAVPSTKMKRWREIFYDDDGYTIFE